MVLRHLAVQTDFEFEISEPLNCSMADAFFFDLCLCLN